MTARYATTCRVCLGPIRPGDEIAKATDGWAHGPCAPGSPVTDAAQAQRPAPPQANGSTTRGAMREMPTVPDALQVWTDGACSGNPGPGGWAWATRDGRRGSGGAAVTTNQRMEIQA